MITENLFDTVLVEPARLSSDKLYIISGYAAATMVSKHFQALKKISKDVKIELIVGMAVSDGISRQDHEGFCSLASESHKDLFICHYVAYNCPVHSKLYAWYSGNVPKIGFNGSANYSQRAFGANCRESIVHDNPEEIRLFFNIVKQDSINCLDPQVPGLITLFDRTEGYMGGTEEIKEEPRTAEGFEGLPHVTVPLLNKSGQVSERSGLNWGQRPEYNRAPNQAYIALPAPIRDSGFFPPRGEHFTILTDDDKTLLCVRAQDSAKAIETPNNNSDLGLYFRNRLNVPEGASVTMDHLQQYGRTDIDFYKIDDETYYMDFSV